MMAGLIIAFIGLCIVLVQVLQVPRYWVPLMVGVGIFLSGTREVAHHAQFVNAPP